MLTAEVLLSSSDHEPKFTSFLCIGKVSLTLWTAIAFSAAEVPDAVAFQQQQLQAKSPEQLLCPVPHR